MVTLSQCPFFDEVQVNTLRYLDQLFQKSDIEKSQFFKKTISQVHTHSQVSSCPTEGHLYLVEPITPTVAVGIISCTIA